MILVGTSGYNYPEWKGSFYPADLPTAKMLPYYAGKFPTVEINYTFYRMPSVAVVDISLKDRSGLELAFEMRSRFPQIYTMDADGTNVQLLTAFTPGVRSYRAAPDWSPDGRAVAFEQQMGDFQVWMIDLRDR